MYLNKRIKKAIKTILLYSYYVKDFLYFNRLNNGRLPVFFKDRYPCIFDAVGVTGYDGHYLYHTSWAARILKTNNPALHVDIGSCLRFITIVSAFIPVDFYDYRPPNIKLTNLNCKHADLLKLPFKDASVESISCMHVLEHVGLGRYGDPLDPDGDLKGAKELERVLAKGGDLLLVVPISGKPRIEFNAHRIYSFSMVKDLFAELSLVEFSLIPDDAISVGIISIATEELADQQRYGCGCFYFKKNNHNTINV